MNTATSLSDLLDQRDHLTHQLLFLDRHVAAIAEEYGLAIDERDRCRELLAQVNEAIGDAAVPVTVQG